MAEVKDKAPIFVDEKDLPTKIRSELKLLQLEKSLESQNRTAWSNLTFIASVLGIALWATIVLHLFGYINFIPVPPKVPGQAVAVSVADVIGVLVPVLLTVVAFFVGATGLKRLQLYDNEFRESRKERREEVEKFQTEVERRIGEVTVRAIEEAQKATTKQLTSKFENFDESIRHQSDQLNMIKAETEEVRSRFGWIIDSNNRDKLVDGSVSSVGELHKTITDLFNANKIQEAKTLVNHHFPENGQSMLRGTSNDFFNTATQLSHSDLEPLPYRVLIEGLRFFPDNPDLLATGLRHAADAGQADAAKALYERAKLIEDEEKNWRLWLFVGDYLEETAKLDEVIGYYRKYAERFFKSDGTRKDTWPKDAPDERMFAKSADFLKSRGRAVEAEFVARLGVDHIPRTPQCSGTLSSIYLENGRFTECVEFAEKALRDDRRDQPHISSGGMLMNIALALDSLAWEAPIKDLEAVLHRVFYAYQTVLKSKKKQPVYAFTIHEQVNALIGYAVSVGLSHDSVVALLPDELRNLMAMKWAPPRPAPSSSGQSKASGPEFLQEILMNIRALSERDEGEWDAGLADLVAKIASADLSTIAKVAYRQAADHFNDDPDEQRFVLALRRIVDML